MQKPEVRIIEPQFEETKEANVSNAERNYLLSKYGFTSPNQQENYVSTENVGLSFEEMIQQEEIRLAEERRRNYERMNRPVPHSFDPDRMNYYENKYSDLDVGGGNYGIQIQIMSDMPINNRSR